jgi:hypothetical protein
MQVETYARVHDVPAEAWDAAAPSAFYFQRRFLEVMEESAVEGASYRYLMLVERGHVVGTAVLSRFTLKLDLLSGDPWIRRLRRFLPRALDVPIVCCGIPASFGQHHLHLVRPEAAGRAVEQVHAAMEAWAEETRCGLLVWKEWEPGRGLREHAQSLGYVVLPTLPDHALVPLAAGVDSFLGLLRSSYRRKYRVAADLMSGPGPVWVLGPLRLEERAFTTDAVAPFYRGYRSVMGRARVRLETYPEAFFEGLARGGLGACTLRLAHEASGQSLDALLLPSGRSLCFALVSKERARYDDALYTLLLQCIVLYAVKRGFAEVRLGQTSSYAKCSVGAQPRRLETFIRMRSPLRQRALRRFGPLLFPEVDAPRLHVFKEAR